MQSDVTARRLSHCNGALCAQNDDAGVGGLGGFAYVAAGELVFGEGLHVVLALNAPHTLVLDTSEALVACGKAGGAPWKAGGMSYTITESPSGCNKAFVQCTNNACGQWKAAGYDVLRCACTQKSAMLD